jgi:hypothetical protein
MYTSKIKNGGTLTIYRDDSDPQNPGWAYRCGDDSGPIDDLDDLLIVLRDYQPESLDDLPTLGGVEPDDTEQVWSWDADRLLVGTCCADLEIVNRPCRSYIVAGDVRALRSEAAQAGDSGMVALCDRALTGDGLAWLQCCEVIEDARAQIDA